jgi:8-oxo-dGTP pyrophosphatase MutT (NUDIX family)
MDRFLRHIAACNNARLPGERLRLRIGHSAVGWVLPPIANALAAFPSVTREPDGVTLAAEAAPSLPDIIRAIAPGRFRLRGEAFDVRAEDGTVLTTADRGALPTLGILAWGVHVNGLVRRPDGVFVWIARRAANKLLDPNKLDHIVAGGVAAGFTPRQTLLKEAEEEAAIPPELAARAVEVGRITYAMERVEGLRRDTLFCYDLDLPPEFVPHAADGEVESFELWPLQRVIETVRDTDDFKFNVNLVLLDLFLRTGLIGGDEAQRLRAALYAA